MVLLLLVHLDARLAALAPLGGFFALRTGEPPHGPLPTLAQAYDRTPTAPDGGLCPDADLRPGTDPDFHPPPAPRPPPRPGGPRPRAAA
ncbi:hypothetical protein ABZ651_33695, partial [Streptomyces sp. NPDC007070]